MTVLDDVVVRFFARRVTREPPGLAQARERVAAAGHEFVHVRLMTGVPHDGVARRLEHAVQGERQLDRAEVRSEVPAGRRERLHQERPDLARERA